MIENFFILKNTLQMPVYLLFFTKKKQLTNGMQVQV
jgi:hypothetical protein